MSTGPINRPRSRVGLRHLAQLGYKASIVVWMVVLVFHTPKLASAALGGTIIVLAAVTILGAIVSGIGLIMSCQEGRVARSGLGLELAGLYSMVVGPLSYLITQIVLASTQPDGWALRSAFVCALLVILLSILSRIAQVAHRWRLLGLTRE